MDYVFDVGTQLEFELPPGNEFGVDTEPPFIRPFDNPVIIRTDDNETFKRACY